jgi:hypothetical protein
MNAAEHETPAVPFNPRRSDDPFHRIQLQAEDRARRNGADEPAAARAGRKAMILRRAILDLKLEPDSELILRTVAGDYRRGD